MIRLILIEIAASAALILVIDGVMQHACSPRRDHGRHRPGRHTLAGAR